MNKRVKSILFIILFSLAIYCFSDSHAENLLENPDFSLLDEEGLPTEWYTDAYILDDGYTVFSTENGDSLHPKTVEINNIGKNDARFAQVVPVEPNTLYRLSGYIRAEGVEGGHGANLSIEGVYAFSPKIYDSHGEWVHIEYYGETGPDQEYVTVFARLGGYSGESTGRAWFADLSLEKADSVPGEGIADLWFREAKDDEPVDSEQEEKGLSHPFWPWLLIMDIVFALISAALIRRFPEKTVAKEKNVHIRRFAEAGIVAAGLVFRLVISSFIEGYMVDVNCFLSWGHTMAVTGPSGFYTATSFCDYPPLYTYILGLNSLVCKWFFAGAPLTRIVFRFVPSLCDVLASWILYRLLCRKTSVAKDHSAAFLILLVFNPALILNSAAWGQMDSVLCLFLLLVAVTAVEGKWICAIPLYAASVLLKPQALMLGPLGLTYMITAFCRDRECRRSILTGFCAGVTVLILGVVPFSRGQNWDWIIGLYSRTLSSYPYATVNTANFYYLLGGNWSGILRPAGMAAPILLALFSFVFGIYWYRRAAVCSRRLIESVISWVFSTWFAICSVTGASWAVIGTSAMIYSFMIVLSPALRSGKIDLLSYLGALLYILLYVFGVKMHERYLFPALLLLAASYVIQKDKRILYLLCLYTFTLFLNEGIVLDNSIRLGSEMGHLNRDTVWLADIIASLNVLGAVYAVWLGIEFFLGDRPYHIRGHKPAFPVRASDGIRWNPDRKLHWSRKDSILVTVITVMYAVVSLLTLGSTKAPQTAWTSSSENEKIIFDLGVDADDFSVLYFAQVSRKDFSFSVSTDAENWSDETWAQMDQGQCWKWKYVTESYDSGDGKRVYYNSDQEQIIRFSGRYLRLSACNLGLILNEIIIRDAEGHTIPARVLGREGGEEESVLYSDPALLLDEQDSLESLPVYFPNDVVQEEPAQPSWWNSTYFDEIYHARTGFEFLHGTVPYETSHPPLGKVLISACIAVFGMTPFGWRFAGALAGILMLPGMYLLGKQLYKKTAFAALACMMMALDCLHLTQTQIATIDSFPVLFIIFAYFFMLRFVQTDFFLESIKPVLLNLFACGLFMGLSIASKWIGIYAGAGLAILFFWHCLRICRLHRSDHSHMVRRLVLRICLWNILFFVIIPSLIYLLSYIPYMAYNTRRIRNITDYISEVWRCQTGMFSYHSTKNLGMDHPFYSPWWEWPIIGKPMYYASEQYIPRSGPVHYSIFCFGNPAIWFGGLAALLVCLFRWLLSKRYLSYQTGMIWHLRSESMDPRFTFIFVGLLAQYLPWVLVPRGTYIYHYFASLPFLMLSVCTALEGYPRNKQKAADRIRILIIFLSAGAFILFFPYASGIIAPSSWMDLGKQFLSIWY